jgi:hypothetical protein
MVTICGYIVYVLVRFFGGAWFALLLMPLTLLCTAGIGVLLPRKSATTGKASAAVLGGFLDGLFTFGLAILISWLFSCSFVWLIGIGMAGTLFSAPKIIFARYAVPASFAAVLALSCWLVF